MSTSVLRPEFPVVSSRIALTGGSTFTRSLDIGIYLVLAYREDVAIANGAWLVTQTNVTTLSGGNNLTVSVSNGTLTISRPGGVAYAVSIIHLAT